MDGFQPAQLSFLAIYNPSLGATEETSHEQIVYYYSSRTGRARKARQTATALNADEQRNEERNEQMRQVGLAQGIVNFAKEFADGRPVDYVDTEKARIFSHEVEPEWWLLASVDLTRFEVPASQDKSSSSKESPATKVEYSARELAPQPLLLKQALRAHGIFLLHHGASLSDIFHRQGRQTLSSLLERFWNRFIRHWDVLMHGSPSIDIFNSLKLAAGGELGIGVGEEEWGSGEREVLEDLVRRTDGLVDLVVSRFGDAPSEKVQKYEEPPTPWLGTGAFPKASDGVILSGVGAAPRIDIMRISAWMEWIYRFGLAAYGVQENPRSARRKRRQRQPVSTSREEDVIAEESEVTSTAPVTPAKGIPPPLVRGASQKARARPELVRGSTNDNPSLIDTETVMKYMTLGIYGSSWGIPSGRPSPARTPSVASRSTDVNRKEGSDRGSLTTIEPQSVEEKARMEARKHPDVVRGCFLIGLKGDLDEETDPESIDSNDEALAMLSGGAASEESGHATSAARRIQLRTIHMTKSSSVNLPFLPASSRLRVVVYAKQPFLYTFLFEGNAQPGLAFASFYRNLHNQIAPLQKPLLRSTSPEDVRRRLLDAAVSSNAQAALSHQMAPIWDLVYDPANGSCHASLPTIPDMNEAMGLSSSSVVGRKGSSKAVPPPWSRAEALAVHNLILKTWEETRQRPQEVERTIRTARGWLVVWLRLPANVEALESAEAAAAATRGSAGAKEREGDERTEAPFYSAVASNTPSIRGSQSGKSEAGESVGNTDEAAGGDDNDDSKSTSRSSIAMTSTDSVPLSDAQGSDGRESRSSEATRRAASPTPSPRPNDLQESGPLFLGKSGEIQRTSMLREAFLVRKTPDRRRRGGSRNVSQGSTAVSQQGSQGGGGAGRFFSFNLGLGFGSGSGSGSGLGANDKKVEGEDADDSGGTGSGGGGGRGDMNLSEGLGIDARKYVEGLLSLNR